jgi:hypothetical protein
LDRFALHREQARANKKIHSLAKTLMNTSLSNSVLSD